MTNEKRDELALREAKRVKANCNFHDIETVAADSFKRGWDACILIELDTNIRLAQDKKPGVKK